MAQPPGASARPLGLGRRLRDRQLARPRNWLAKVYCRIEEEASEQVSKSLLRGIPLDNDAWTAEISTRLGLDINLRPCGRRQRILPDTFSFPPSLFRCLRTRGKLDTMENNDMPDTGEYQDCYVAFLDILGFRQLVERSVDDDALLVQISSITTLAATPKSGIKQTSLGPCPMQVRAFSDSIVVFTPTNHPNRNGCNPLAQLCFVVRYLHDRVLEMDACIRGGVTIGKMYWHPSWSDTAAKPKRGSRGAQPITFGPGLNAAYDLESKLAVYPRVLVDASIPNALLGNDPPAWPLADYGMRLRQCFRVDPTDGKVHLDLLNAVVVRSERETMHTSPDGFTVTWENHAQSMHALMLQRAKQLAHVGIEANAACEKVRAKYEWLRAYSGASTPPNHGGYPSDPGALRNSQYRTNSPKPPDVR